MSVIRMLSSEYRATLAQICEAMATWVEMSMQAKKSGSTPKRIFYDVLDYHYEGRRGVLGACDDALDRISRDGPARPLYDLIDAIRDFADVDQHGGVDPIDPIASAVAAIEGDQEVDCVIRARQSARLAVAKWHKAGSPSPAETEALKYQESGFAGFLGDDPAGSVVAFRAAARTWPVEGATGAGA